MKLSIYSARITPRVQYAFRLLFDCALGLPFELTDHWSRFLAQEGHARLVYGPAPPGWAGPRLAAGPLLFETGIKPQPIGSFHWEGRAAGFPVEDAANALLPFDLPAWAFYLASRYEEYLPFAGDELGRFPAQASLAAREGFLEQPLIQHLALALLPKLQAHYSGLYPSLPAYTFRPTYDIDMAWAYQNRPHWLTAAGTLRDALAGRTALQRQRWAVLSGRAQDPFDTFGYLEALHERWQLSPLYFFLLGDYGRYDKNAPPHHPALQQQLGLLAKRHDTGLHPSFRSNGKAAQLDREKARYADITGAAPKRSRQHFLMLRFPQTYRALMAAGIEHDYSMGYADAAGFRASLAVPFPWYDLEQDAEQPLWVHPFPLMDGTLRQYMQLSPEQASDKIRQLLREVRTVGGPFLPLWHNSSFSELHGWRGWQIVFEQMLADGQALSSRE